MPETHPGNLPAPDVIKLDDDEVMYTSSLESNLQEAGGRRQGGYGGGRNGGGRNGGGNGNGRTGKCHPDALANDGKGCKSHCYRDGFPEIYDDNGMQNRAPAEEIESEVLRLGDDGDISSDKLQAGNLGWSRCRRGLDVVDTTGLCCKRGLNGACCNGWILKRDHGDDDDKLQVDGWGNKGRCRRTLGGVGHCCVEGH